MKRKSYLEGWRLYPWCMAGHHAEGALVGIFAMTGAANLVAVAALSTALYIAYQGLSVLRKQDSPGLDIADFMVGFGGGVAGSVLLSAV